MYEDWKKDGACHGVAPEIARRFFDYRWFDQVKMQYCDHCPVRDYCLEYALEPKEVLTDQGRGMLYRGEDYGIWGGLTPEERDLYAKRTKRRGLRG